MEWLGLLRSEVKRKLILSPSTHMQRQDYSKGFLYFIFSYLHSNYWKECLREQKGCLKIKQVANKSCHQVMQLKLQLICMDQLI